MSLFSIGLSGLSAAQIALQTTSSNISNVYTPGYNRQLTLLGENGIHGGGVQVNDVQRQFSTYIAEQLNQATSSASALSAYETQISQIDNLLADREAGLAPLMQSFFSSLEDMAGAPSDPAARQGVIGNANTLTAQFRAFDSYLDDMQSGINGQIRDEVTQINNAADQMAMLNRQIALAKAKTGEAPNSLLNQRDELVANISERIGVSLVVQDNGTYNLTIGNGQPLVAGNRSFELEAMRSSNDPSRIVVGYNDAGGNLIELDEATFDNGTLGGLMTFRRESLDQTQNQVGQLALSLAEGFNAQHRLGRDLDGERGQEFFAIGGPTVYSNDNNTGDAVISAEFSDFTAVTTSDYEVSYDGSAYSVVRSDTGADVTFTAGTDGAGNTTLTFDGVTLTVESGTAQAGDTFAVQPTRNLAGQFENLIDDTADIAAASLVQVEANSANSGTLGVEGISAERGYQLPTSNMDLTVSNVDATTGSYTLGGFTAGMNVSVNGTVYNNPETGVMNLQAGDTITVDGVSFTLTGQAADGDRITFGSYPEASGDNRNALAMQNLQDAELVGGESTFSQTYASLVSVVGNQTNVAKVNLAAQQGLAEQLTAVQQSKSGVNLNEEAANLIRYQQFFQANAQVIQTGSTVLDTILGLR
ncbi:flagellar hook-associated protein FlgK [Modicisalibacter muralis]|uniref:Flagellar hook-associated protein 1 n=1 Tax=Modicisalibacter muralis TaxID=119000 RepID=A0A1G9FTP5_9GAMM|nr:flagellar hook-associated protein FlgK [Halomonas muralis]SDK91768.1 flagellar hook-associated protein FlgK [Halomonas muralis]